MKWSKSIRQAHRWLGVIFTVTVFVNFAVLAFGEPPFWVYLLPLPPLFLLMFSGWYLFALPYVLKRRVARGAVT